MKKFILSLMMSLSTMGLFAIETQSAPKTVDYTSYAATETVAADAQSQMVKLSTQRFTEADLSGVESVSNDVITRAGAVSIDDIVGARYTLAHVYSSSVYTAHSTWAAQATVAKASATAVNLIGFFFGANAKQIKADVDLNTGVVTIKPQAALDVKDGTTTIGTAYICKMNLQNNTYDSKAEIKGHVYGKSIIIDDSFGFFITTGAYAGATINLGFTEYAAITPLSGTVEVNRIEFKGDDGSTDNTVANRKITTQNTPMFSYPVGKDILRVMYVPMLNNFTDFNITLNPNGTMSINPQPVSFNSLLGEISAYSMTEKVADGKITFSISLLSPIKANYSAETKTISLGGYAAASASSLFGAYESAKITLTEEVEFPEVLKFNLEGEGTAEKPYLIKNANDFAMLSQDILTNTEMRGNAITEGTGADAVTYYNVYEGKYFALDADIDFDSLDVAYTPIGNTTYMFAGVLDGKNHKIDNFSISNYAYDYCGLFGVIGAPAKVSNLTFNSPYIKTMGFTAGALAGRTYGAVSNITLNNPTVYATSGYNVGALVGYLNATAENITVNSAVVQAKGYAGGLAGRSYYDITNVHVTGRVVITDKSVFGGGIVGQAIKVTVEQPQPVISGCSFAGSVTSSKDQVGIGGLFGALSYSKLTTSFANAQVVNSGTTQCYIGGLVGDAYQSEIENCYFSGFARNAGVATCAGIVGQIVRSVSTETVPATKITNCYVSGMIASASIEETRAFIGRLEGAEVANCYFDNQIAPLEDAKGGVATSVLTSGEALSGFSTDVWSFNKGLYPSLKGIAMNDAVAVSTAPLTLAAGNVLDNITKDFTYSTANDVKWVALQNGAQDANGGYAFGFSDGVGVLNTSQHTDTIFAIRGNASKYYFVNIAPVVFEGEGTAENPWKIRNKEEFKLFSNITVNATMPFADKYFVLTNDIDFEGDTIVPVCKNKVNSATPTLKFQGTFDGNGHTVDNFVVMAVEFFTADNTTGTAVPGQVNPKSANCYYNSGLFAAIGANGVVKNLTVGAKAQIHSFQRGGALAGYSEGTVENCANYSTLRVYYSAGGGIVGYLNAGKVINCYNNGNVYANANTAGGIVGEAAAGSLIQNCENTGEVAAYWFNPYQKEASQYGAGGIVGTFTSATIQNVVNSGSVWSYKQVGGIVSKITGTAAKPALVENAVHYGFVKALNEKVSLGKIAGINTLGTFKNCYADAQMQKGGLVANGDMTGCANVLTDSLAAATVALPDSAFALKAGVYPTLKYETVPAQVAVNSKAVLSLAAGQFANAIFSNATLSADVKWSLKNNAVFSIDGTTLKVMEVNAGSFADTLVAVNNGAERKLSIATMTLNPLFLDGEGTAQSPFIITDPMEFKNLAVFMNQNDFDYQGYFFKVKNDLDFKDIDFVQINNFAGSFDGNGKVFANVSHVAELTDKTALGRALFGTVTADAEVKGITLDANSTINAYTYAGGIVAHLYGKVSDCTNRGTVSTYGTTNAGGIVAIAYVGASINNCSNEGAVTSKTTYAGGVLGSSAAQAKIEVKDCSNKGAVTGTSKIGGVVGSASAYVYNAKNEGAVTATTTYAAGIIGEALLPSSIYNSTNAGEITTPQYLAGIVALSAAQTAEQPFELIKCSNTANLTVGAKGFAAGVSASTKAGMIATDCYNTGNIIGKTDEYYIRIAGVFADAASSKTAPSVFTNCYNTGDITCYTNSGGVFGYITSDGAVVKNCYNTGNITAGGVTAKGAVAAANIGGIIGNGKANMYDCWNSGDISAKGYYVAGIRGTDVQDSTYYTVRCANFGDVVSTSYGVGGIVGNGRGNIISCYNFGMLTGTNQMGGIVAFPGAAASPLYTMKIENCYNVGEILTSGTNAGNIASNNTSMKYLKLANNYYNSDVNEALAEDSKAGVTGVTTAELVALDLGSDYVKAEATYPTLVNLVDNTVNSFYVATVLVAEGETLDRVSKAFLIGTPKGAQWTATGNITINGNTVTPKPEEDGEKATLTLTVGELTRTYDLVLYKSSGVDTVGAEGKEVAKVSYYLVNGMQIASPDGVTEVVVEKTVYTDGTSSVRKFVPVK